MNDLLKEYQDFLKNLPQDMAVLAGNDTMRAFEDQSWNGDKWDKRKNEPLKQRALLVNSSKLKGSIDYKAENNGVTVVTDSKYAQIHNEGGEVKQTPTFKQRAFFAYKSSIATSENEKQMWLAMSKAKELNIKIPKRQFMGFSDKFWEDLDKVINNKLDNLFL